MDDRTIIATALKDTYIKYFQMTGMRRRWSSGMSTRYFSRRWHELSQEFNKLNKKRRRIAPLLLKAHDHAVKVQELYDVHCEIIAAKFPVQYNIRSAIVKSSVDLILLRHPPRGQRVLEIYYFDDSLSKKDRVSFEATVRAMLGLASVRRDLGTRELPTKCILFNVLGTWKKEIALRQDQQTNYPRVLRALVKGIEAEAIYPRASSDACEHCTFNSKCQWSF